MASDRGTSASMQQNPQPHKRLNFMDLPNDAIEEVVRYAENSICDFARAHPRFAAISSKMRWPRLSIRHICTNLQRSVALNFQSVRSLSLMHCHSESSVILSLILRCPQLIELNTVNSGLTTPDLVESFTFLSQLETLSFTTEAGLVGAEPRSYPDHLNIRSLYVEHGSDALPFVITLINSCVKIERLHLIEAPFKSEVLPPWWFFPGLHQRRVMPPPIPSISRERWQTLQTVISTKIHRGHHRMEFDFIFGNRVASRDVTYEDFHPEADMVYDRGFFNVKTPREPIVDYESPLLDRLYIVGPEDPVWHYGQPRRLKITKEHVCIARDSLPRSMASLTSLVELDLSACHTKHFSEFWPPFFKSATCLESLTLPFCLLAVRCCRGAAEEEFSIVTLLETLKLKKLSCSRLDCRDSCHQSPVMPNLTSLVHVEELLLINPPTPRDFLQRIAIRSLSCLRIVKKDHGYLNVVKLKSFFATCTNLRFLKLDWESLPLEERLIWWRLSAANLKQLCISTRSSRPVDLRMVRRFLPALCRNLQVLHIHASRLPNEAQFCNLVADEIAKINLSREHDPLGSLLPLPGTYHEHLNMIPNFPGRAFCCTSLDSKLDLMSWKIE